MIELILGRVSGLGLRVQDVFAAALHTGNGSTQTITNGINLSTHGGLVWLKNRSAIGWNHQLSDTARGVQKTLQSNLTNAEATDANYLTAFNSNGFSLGSNGNFNNSGDTYVSWTFRKAAKFFDVVTWTGDGVAGRAISHSLGQAPGMIIVKSTSDAEVWRVYHRSLGASDTLQLNSTSAADTGNASFHSTTPTSSVFYVGPGNQVNGSGKTYVAYLFAHDTSSTGLIQCSSFTTNGSGAGSFDFGWSEGVQYIELKTSSTTGDWEVFDTARTSGFSGDDARLRTNLSSAEDTVARLSFSGTTLSFAGLSASQTYIFTAVRAPS